MNTKLFDDITNLLTNASINNSIADVCTITISEDIVILLTVDSHNRLWMTQGSEFTKCIDQNLTQEERTTLINWLRTSYDDDISTFIAGIMDALYPRHSYYSISR